MKKYILLLLLIVSIAGHSQTFIQRVMTVVNSDTGRTVPALLTGGAGNKIKDSLMAHILLRLQISDTSAMLTNYRNAMIAGGGGGAGKLNISDTAAMLANYLTAIIAIPTKVKYSDTAAMLLAYKNLMIDNAAKKVNISDTASMLANYLTGLIAIPTKVKYTDTAAMLNNYRTGMIANTAGKVNISDTAAMLLNYKTGMIANTAGKLNISDTAAMLLAYKNAMIANTANKATIQLDNLGTTSINAALLAQTGIDLGSTTKPFRSLYLYGAGTYGTNYFNITGTPTGTRTITIPDATLTLARIDAAQTFAGTQTFSSNIVTSTIQTGTGSVANLFVSGGTTIAGSQSGADYLPTGVSSLQYRTAFYGSTSTVLTAANGYAGVVFCKQLSTEATSGVNPLSAAVAIIGQTITNGTGTTTDASTLYIEGPPTGTATITNPVSSLWVNTGVTKLDEALTLGYATTATSLTLDATKYVQIVSATGQTITLPTSVGITGRQYVIKLTASGSCTVATTSSQTIDGSTTYSLASQYKYVHVVSDGANWSVIGNN